MYILTEGGGANAPGDMLVWASHDQGQTWEEPVLAGQRDGSGRMYPVVSAAPGGVAWALWMDCGSAANCADEGGDEPTSITVARSTDAGATWQDFGVTPFAAYIDYPTIAAGPNGTVAVAFYATTDLPVGPDSEWFVYAGMARAPEGSTPAFDVVKASPEVVYTGQDLHALHDFFEIAIGPDETLHVSYQHTEGAMSEDGLRRIFYAQGRV